MASNRSLHRPRNSSLLCLTSITCRTAAEPFLFSTICLHMHRKSIDNLLSIVKHPRLSNYVTTITYNDAVVLDERLLEADILAPVDLLAFHLAIRCLRHRIKRLEIIASRYASDTTPALFHPDTVLSVSNFIRSVRAHGALDLDIQLFSQAWDGSIEHNGTENRPDVQKYLELLTTRKVLKHLSLICPLDGKGSTEFRLLEKTLNIPSMLTSLHVHYTPGISQGSCYSLMGTSDFSRPSLEYLSLQGTMLCQHRLESFITNFRHSLKVLRLGDIAFLPIRDYRIRVDMQIEKASWVTFVHCLQELFHLERFELHGLLQIRTEGEKSVVLKEIWDEFDASGEISHHGLAVQIEQFVVGQADTPFITPRTLDDMDIIK